MAGGGAVNWALKDPTGATFPPYKGVVPIVLAWFVSPVLTATASVLLMLILRTLVLRRENSYSKSFWVLPPFVVLTTWINIYFVFTKVRQRRSASRTARERSATQVAHQGCGCCAVVQLLGRV